MDEDVKNKIVVLASHNQEKQESANQGQIDGLRLADFIHENMEQIVAEWESFARTLTPAATDMTPLALRNHIYEILAFIVTDIKSPQTNLEQVEKSQGKK